MVTLRSWRIDDMPFLWEMLYQSIHVPPGREPPPRSVLEAPDFVHYLDRFGTRPGDDAEIAVDDDGSLVGAAFCRCLDASDPGYGFVAGDIPEVGMAVVAGHRGRGIGRNLLQALLLRHPVMSLSVDMDNVLAKRLYESIGFVDVELVGTSMTMLRRPTSPPVHTNGGRPIGLG